MSVKLMDGFDHLQSETLKGWIYERWSAAGDNRTSYAHSTGRVNGYCLVVRAKAYTNTSLDTQMRKALPSTYSEVVVGVAIYRPTPGWSGGSDDGYDTIRLLSSGAAFIAGLRFDSSNRPYVVNSSGTTIASSSTVISDNTWNYYELRVKINGASGECELRVNGGADIATTTGNFGSTNIGQVGLSCHGNGSFSGDDDRYLYYDDLYVIDTSGSAPRNTFLGDCRVETLFPTGAGNHTDWTPNTGSNYAAVDEHASTYPDDDTTYVGATTVGAIDTYAMGNLSISNANVYAVQVNLHAKKDTAGTKQIKAKVRQSGTDYSGATTHTLSTSYVSYQELMEQDPAAADWTVANVNGDEFGVEVVT